MMWLRLLWCCFTTWVPVMVILCVNLNCESQKDLIPFFTATSVKNEKSDGLSAFVVCEYCNRGKIGRCGYASHLKSCPVTPSTIFHSTNCLIGLYLLRWIQIELGKSQQQSPNPWWRVLLHLLDHLISNLAVLPTLSTHPDFLILNHRSGWILFKSLPRSMLAPSIHCHWSTRESEVVVQRKCWW